MHYELNDVGGGLSDDFNKMPPGLRRITLRQLANDTLFFVHAPKFIESRQISGVPREIWNKDYMLDGWLYHFHDGTGVLLHGDHRAGGVIAFAFGCRHDKRELSREECASKGIPHEGACWHVYECARCGFVEAHDSSD
jgi:hypothetical protein